MGYRRDEPSPRVGWFPGGDSNDRIKSRFGLAIDVKQQRFAPAAP